MNDEDYQKLVKEAPQDHLSDEFIMFLANNNEVVALLKNWIIIKNCKHHRDSRTWYTAFAFNHALSGMFLQNVDWEDLMVWIPRGMAVMVRKEEDRSIDRFHAHIFDVKE